MASCFCGGSARRRRGSQHVKLVFPGGHVELLDRPVLAAEVMAQHPRFCVARPEVFREPVGAVAAPDAMLHLGHKYYVVPKSTVRRLLKYSSSSSSSHGASGSRGSVSLRKHLARPDGHERGGGKKWFNWAVAGAGAGANPPQRPPQDDVSDGSGSEGEAAREVGVREKKKVKGKSVKKRESPGRRRRQLASPADSASYSWQPSLHSITEE
uniref:Uncharacterized protein n=1 Tax=Avena sativa TaxID=4498 RepID=A0ACD5WVW5_AVESA